MSYSTGERLRALSGGNGIGAAVLLILGVLYRVAEAAGTADFVLGKLPWLRNQLHAFRPMNTLILLALMWILAILVWPAELGPHGARVRRMRRLLKEAAEFHEKHGQTVKKFSDDSVHEAAWRMARIFSFLEMAFRPRILQEFMKDQDRDHEKHKAAGVPFDPDRTISQMLFRLRGRITADDLDLSFHLPDTYRQFYQLTTGFQTL